MVSYSTHKEYLANRNGFKLVFVLLACCLSACSSMEYQAAKGELYAYGVQRHHIDGVPLIAQDDNQCGPASLATLLQFHGVNVTALDLKKFLYLPNAQGTLQLELVSAVRNHAFVPYAKKSSFSELATEVSSNNPTLVLLNLGLDKHPVWHFAVVVGYDTLKRKVYLHSGKPQVTIMSLKRFEYAWRKSDYWSLSIHSPQRLPKYANRHAIYASIANIEALGKGMVAKMAYLQAIALWGDDEIPLLGLGNLEYSSEKYHAAIDYYHQALPLSKRQDLVRFNIALALLKLKQTQEAKALLEAIVDRNELPPSQIDASIQLINQIK